MMTTGKVFDIPQTPRPFIHGNTSPTAEQLFESREEEPAKPTKEELLNGYIQQYLKGELTEKQLKVIKETLS